MEKRWRRFIGYFFMLFLLVPILAIGGISTAAFTDTQVEFELVYHVIFLGALDGLSLICLIGSTLRLRELKKFKGEIVTYSLFKKKRSVLPKSIVYFHVGIIIAFCSFIILTTGLKLISSMSELINANM